MDKDEGYNSGSDEKICSLSGSGDRADLDRIKSLVKNSRYVCSSCGRAAVDSENLCAPEML